MNTNGRTTDNLFDKRFRHQLLVTLTVNIITFCHGIGLGWLAPMLRKMQSDESPMDFPVSVAEASWIGSMVGLGSLIGNVIFGLLVDRIGRKWCIYLLAVPHMLLWIFIYAASSVEYLYMSRLMGGITGGGSYLVIPIFIAEIADPLVRGRLASMFMLSINIGMLAGFIIATHIKYHLIPCMVIVLPILYIVLAWFFPETPQQLLRKGHDKSAEESARFYKNIQEDHQNSDLMKFNEDFIELQKMVPSRLVESKGGGVQLKDFYMKRSLKPISMGLVLLALNQFSGSYALVNYMSTIFSKTGTNIDPNTNTIAVGVVQIFGAYTATILVDRYGRKILMIVSYVGMAVGMAAFGLFAYFATDMELSHLSWLLLVIMSFVIFIANVGLVSVTFVILVEILPPKIRSMASFFCLCCLSVMVFGSLKVFPIFMHTFGLPATMWSCSFVCGVGVFYVVVCLPETKGKPVDKDEDFH